ncbi:MAG: hypothetical protein K5780_04960 [Alphaproteobacteria bacterium]|nr:hypothetical protein [Alphaproteobacteria bacterium]
MKISLLSICSMLLALYGTECSARSVDTSSSGTIDELRSRSAKRLKKSYTLKEIDDLQNQYFKIIKRNDVLLSDYVEDVHIKDSEELASLYKELKAKIEKNNAWLKKYRSIQAKFELNEGETTYDTAEFEGKHYKEIDTLLNDIFKSLKSKLTANDFKNLQISQRSWLKEVINYRKVFNSQELGTMRIIKKIGYETDMRKFRILLLILYSQQKSSNSNKN